MSRVRIVQCLCPRRHCIMATAYVSADGEPMPAFTEHLRSELEAAVDVTMYPTCMICHAPMSQWRYEDGPTRFTTPEEAAPFLEAEAAKQKRANEFFRRGRN